MREGKKKTPMEVNEEDEVEEMELGDLDMDAIKEECGNMGQHLDMDAIKEECGNTGQHYVSR